MIDDYRFVFFGQRDEKDPVSITSLLGTVFFIGIYFFGFGFFTIQSIVLLLIALMGIWRSFREDQSWNIAFITSLIFVHTIIWSQLTNILEGNFIPSIFSRADFLGLVLLDGILIFGNLLQFKLWKTNIYNFVIYALGFQLGLLTFVFSQQVNSFIPDWIFLGFSVLSLEVGRRIPQLFRYNDEVKHNIRDGMTHIGLAYFILFLIRFVIVHFIQEPILNGIYMRWMTETMGLSAISYWIAFAPQKEASSKFERICYDGLIEVCIGFITVCSIAELSEIWMPFFWEVMAIGLVIGSLIHNWPHRLCIYSWIYLIVSIIHSVLLSNDSANSILMHNIPAFLAVSLQLYYAFLVHRKQGELLKRGDSSSNGISRFIPILYRQPNMTIVLPIFMGIALLFAFDFSDTILTFLWVVLGCIYLAIGLFVKSKRTIQIAMGALVLCCLRLMVFDMVQSDAATRALVFLGVGGLMLGVSILYKKFKHRIEFEEISPFESRNTSE
jgi:hypothetical protein